MGELIEDIREDIKREDLLNMWRRYGYWIIGGVVIFILGTISFLYWQSHQEKTKLKNAQVYEKIMAELDPQHPQKSLIALQELASKAPSGYSILAGFIGAGLSNDAAVDLKNMAQDPKIEKSFQEIALILSALADLDGANPRAILDRLSIFESSASPFRPLAREIMGYAMIRLGNDETAMSLFQSLMHEQMATQPIRARAQAMVDSIRGKHQ